MNEQRTVVTYDSRSTHTHTHTTNSEIYSPFSIMALIQTHGEAEQTTRRATVNPRVRNVDVKTPSKMGH